MKNRFERTAHQGPNHTRNHTRDSGFVLLSVLLVLLALLVLAAPFLAGSRDASRQGALAADRAQAEFTLRSASEAARARLGQSHPALDATPDSDSYEELMGSASTSGGTGMGGVLWGVAIEDESARIDLNSASPQVLANLLGWQTRLAEVLSKDAKEAQVSEVGKLAPEGGVVVARGEWIAYGKIESGRGGRRLVELERGLETNLVDEVWQTWGPRPPSNHGFGTPMIDQRVYAFLDRRIQRGAEGRLYRFDVMEELHDVPEFARQPMGTENWREPIEANCTTYADQAGGNRWQMPERILNELTAGETFALQPEFGAYFSEGTTILISGDGYQEIRYVTAVSGSMIRMNRTLEHDYRANAATVSALVRRPVNLNTASPEVLMALFENLALVGRNERISQGEAQNLTAWVLQARPFAHREDFLERVVLPAGGLLPETDATSATGGISNGAEEAPAAVISPEDALALYINGLNANDTRLAFGTMPFCFTSRDVYRMDLRASVQARNGLQRVFRRREQVQRVVPQRPLLTMFHRQEDFERGLVLDRKAPYWMTGPEATSAFDERVPPSRAYVQLGTRAGRVVIPGITKTTEGQLSGRGTHPARVSPAANRVVGPSCGLRDWAIRPSAMGACATSTMRRRTWRGATWSTGPCDCGPSRLRSPGFPTTVRGCFRGSPLSSG